MLAEIESLNVTQSVLLPDPISFDLSLEGLFPKPNKFTRVHGRFEFPGHAIPHSDRAGVVRLVPTDDMKSFV
jgi:hypothetical protein